MSDSKVVLIKGSHSEWFEQAIFILKSPVSAANKNIVDEAEKIINDYMSSGNMNLSNSMLKKYGSRVNEKDAAALRTNRNTCVVRIIKKKTDYVSILINIALVASSVLLGFLLHKIIG